MPSPVNYAPQAETDPVFSASDAFGITSTDIGNWNTAAGYGDHAAAGYLTTVDISADTNLAVTAPIVLTGDTLSLNLAATYGWTGAHTWGSDGSGVDATFFGATSGDKVFIDANGGTGGALRMTIDGAGELVVDGKSAFGTGTIGGTYGLSLIAAGTTFAPGVGQTAACIEFAATMNTASIFNGMYGFQMSATVSATGSSLLAESYRADTILANSSGTITYAVGYDAFVNKSASGGAVTHGAAYMASAPSSAGGTFTNYYVLFAPQAPSAATNNWNFWFKNGNSRFGDDNARACWGTADDAYIAFDGSNLVATVAAVTSSAQFVLADCGIVVNEAGGDKDTRIEGDTLPYMLFLDASAATENIALVTGSAPNWQGMDRGVFLGDATTVPTGNPTSGIFIYSESGAGKARGASGTVTTWAPAEPHCPVCGMDFIHEWENKRLGKYLAVCMNCLTEELGERPYVLRSKAG